MSEVYGFNKEDHDRVAETVRYTEGRRTGGRAQGRRVRHVASVDKVQFGYTTAALTAPTAALEAATVAVDRYEPNDSGRLVYQESITMTSYSADAEAEPGTYCEFVRTMGVNLLLWLDCDPSAEKLTTESGDGLTDESGEFIFAE